MLKWQNFDGPTVILSIKFDGRWHNSYYVRKFDAVVNEHHNKFGKFLKHISIHVWNFFQNFLGHTCLRVIHIILINLKFDKTRLLESLNLHSSND